MTLEQQVCSLEQGKRLKELGITARSFASWVFDTLNNGWDLSGLCVEAHALLQREAFPAFTSAELGEMLPDELAKDYFLSTEKCDNGEGEKSSWLACYRHWWDRFTSTTGGLHMSEAEARAALLIKLLESNYSADEVNARLSA